MAAMRYRHVSWCVGPLVLGLSAGIHAQALDPAAPAADPLADRGEDAPTQTGGAADEGSGFRLDLYLENDSRFLKPNNPHDRYYTNGVKLALTHHPAWADRLNEAMPFRAPVDYTRTAAGYVAGQNIYTPADTDRRDPDPDDRPYAGWLYAGAFWERIAAREMDHYEIDVGLTGPSSLAEQAQNGFHDAEDVGEARGWGHQLRDEPAFDFIYYRKWKFPLLRGEGAGAFGGLQSDVIPRGGFTAGTAHVHADLGATWRLGFRLPDDFGPSRLSEASAPPASEGASPRPLGAYLFGRANGRAVAHNLFLEGNTFRDSRGVDAEPLLGEFEAGVSAYYRRFTLTYSQTYQTEEFRGQDGGHSFGSVLLSWDWSF